MTRDQVLNQALLVLRSAEKNIYFNPEKAEAGAKIAHGYIELAKELRLGS